jgi:hypothetical protein
MTKEKRQNVKGRKYWMVEGWDGPTLIYTRELPVNEYSARQMTDLLRLLVAQTSLTLVEITEATGRSPSPLLNVHQQFRPLALMCGNKPHFGARVFEKKLGAVAATK